MPSTALTWPMHSLAEGVRMSSTDALSVASVKKCAAVSNDIFRNGDTLDSMPMRLQAR